MKPQYTYAIIEHEDSYDVFYDELLSYLRNNFSNVKSGLQGDAWIWIEQDDQKVALDTFYSMKFEIKSHTKDDLLLSVIDCVRKRYNVSLLETPIER